jgi:hypothetical protein
MHCGSSNPTRYDADIIVTTFSAGVTRHASSSCRRSPEDKMRAIFRIDITMYLIVFAKLTEPVGRVYFSGKHASAEYFGYVHGAHRVGTETAEQIL